MFSKKSLIVFPLSPSMDKYRLYHPLENQWLASCPDFKIMLSWNASGQIHAILVPTSFQDYLLTPIIGDALSNRFCIEGLPHLTSPRLRNGIHGNDIIGRTICYWTSQHHIDKFNPFTWDIDSQTQGANMFSSWLFLLCFPSKKSLNYPFSLGTSLNWSKSLFVHSVEICTRHKCASEVNTRTAPSKYDRYDFPPLEHINCDLRDYSSSILRTLVASCGTSTEPIAFIRFLPAFCFSRRLRFRETSPP